LYTLIPVNNQSETEAESWLTTPITTTLVNVDVEYKRWKRDPEAYQGFTGGDAYVLASTTACLVIGDSMREYLNAFPADLVSGRPVAAVGVHAGDTKCYREMAHIFKAKGGVVCSHADFKAPINSINTSRMSSYPKRGYMQVWPKAAHDKVLAYGDSLRASLEQARLNPTMKYKMPLGLSGMTIASFNPPSGRLDRAMGKAMGKLLVDPQKCL
ncbi:hypothetical protein KIPB_009166, partial [Kipferlia bialata]